MTCHDVPYHILMSCMLGVMSPTANEDVKRKHQVAIAEYFHHNRRRNSLYGLKFFGSEILNLINCGLQIYLIDSLLGEEFSTYGLRVLHFATLDDEVSLKTLKAESLYIYLLQERIDPIVRIFPKVTKCSFQNFGVSGSIQKYQNRSI